MEATLPNHTIYRLKDLSDVTEPMPIVVWANGLCAANSTVFTDFLLKLAEHGVMVIANGTPGGSGSSSAQWLRSAITWAINENSRPGSPYEGKLDTDAISAQGQSCGGYEALATSAADPRVSSTVLWNIGVLPLGGFGVTKDTLNHLHAPIAYITGGPCDTGFSDAVDDYSRLPADIPAVLAHFGCVGHGGNFEPEYAAESAGVDFSWLQLVNHNDDAARQLLIWSGCGLCTQPLWVVTSKNWPHPYSCAVGTYSGPTIYDPCPPAAPGFFVATAGALEETPCALGTYQPMDGMASCLPAPIGSYVNFLGATAATPCPEATTTSADGATSDGDCVAVESPPAE